MTLQTSPTKKLAMLKKPTIGFNSNKNADNKKKEEARDKCLPKWHFDIQEQIKKDKSNVIAYGLLHLNNFSGSRSSIRAGVNDSGKKS